MLIVLFGALLLICGLLYMLWQALVQKPLTDPTRRSRTVQTLEPRRQGVGFLGLRRNWPGLALMAIGALCLVYGAAV